MNYEGMDDYDKFLLQAYEADLEEDVQHYGTPRHSGRYPWGSGDNPYQHNQNFHVTYNKLHNQGVTDKQMAAMFGCNIDELRARRSNSSAQERARNVTRAKKLRAKGYGATQIGRLMGGLSESTIRGYLKEGVLERAKAANVVANGLEKNMKDKGGYIDISAGVEREMNCSRTKFDAAVKLLEEKGYSTATINVRQVTNPGQYTKTKVLIPPGQTKRDVVENFEKIRPANIYLSDDGAKIWTPEYPKAISRDRVGVRYYEDGGVDKDGVIEIRRGVDDLSLGNAQYAQVRIAIGKNMYAKGMAVYSDDLPDGIDILVNSNRHRGAPDLDDKETHKEGVFKEIKNETEADEAFGAKIKPNGQYHSIDKNGVEQLGVINKVNDQGDWSSWSKTLSSQFLSKQPLELISRQLDMTYAGKLEEYEKISQLTNPAVRQKLLETFASQCDGAAVDLKATSLPGQQSHVLLPINSLGENEVYAPNYETGTKVALVRYPHQSISEIPILVVNNNNEEGKKVMGSNAPDAIGIRKEVADKLSGADFDGDAAAVIPVNERVRIAHKDTFPELVGFDTKEAYPYVEGMKVLTKKDTQMEMGKVSNLLTDMHIKGADDHEIAKALKHSMVVIDAAKHKLNYKQSEIDNQIAELKAKYQGGPTKGASTLISKASAQAHINERQMAILDKDTGDLKKTWKPDPETGKIMYKETGRQYKKYEYLREKGEDGKYHYVLDEDNKRIYKLDADGNPKFKWVNATQKVKGMMAVEDARELSTGTPVEEVYASYANKMKELGNRCRKDAAMIKPISKDKAAEAFYKEEVDSLNSKLDRALRNAPKERAALVIANVAMNQIRDDNPDLSNDQIKKLSQIQMTRARAQVGANKSDVQVHITPKEWEAIQHNALSTAKQKAILNNCDMDEVRKLATPKDSGGKKLSSANRNAILSMKGTWSNKQLAERYGVSVSTIQKVINGTYE
ncbi:MAG: helix-turn-helix domain-containing protein [Pseudobutyrivibrio sp.]|nr:helix-turn-helix domain-containing protein [Pseudobutyrivibrio sp.]